MYDNAIAAGQVDPQMWKEYYQGYKSVYEQSIKPGMLLQYGPDWAFNQQVVSNLSTFSAFKNHANSQDLINQLISPNGDFKTYRQWRKDVNPILGKYNEEWLKAEHQTAVAASRMAEKWRNFQRRKATYPNLKYLTQEDDRVRETHRPLHAIIRPVDDPFWDTFYPPNGWRCRCTVIQTDEPAQGTEGSYIVPHQWRYNVAKSRDLYPPDHPYKIAAQTNKTKIERESRRLEGGYTRSAAREWAMANLRDRDLVVPGLERPARMARKDINKYVSSYHPHPAMKNNLLFVVEQILAEGQVRKLYRKAADTTKHAGARWFYYYLLELEGIRFYLNFLEYAGGDIRLYAITHEIK